MLERFRKHIWLDDLVEQSKKYNLWWHFELYGKVDYERLQKSLYDILCINEDLNIYVSIADGEVRERIATPSVNCLEYINLENLSKSEAGAKISEAIQQGLNIEIYPLYRFYLFKTENEKYEFVLLFHHGVMDGFSLRAFVQQIFKSYENSSCLEKRQFSFRVGDRYTQKTKDFWNDYLKNIEIKAPFPQIEASVSYGSFHYFSIDLSHIKNFIEIHIPKATIFNVILSAYAAFIARLYMQDNLIITYPINLREKNNNVLGCYINNIPQNFFIDPAQNFKQFVNNVISDRKEIKKYQQLPFFDILNELRNKTDRKYLNLKNLAIAETCLRYREFDLSDLKVIAKQAKHNEVIYDLLLEYELLGDSLLFRLNYRNSILSDKEAEYFCKSFSLFFQHCLTSPDTSLQNQVMLDENTKNILFKRWKTDDVGFGVSTLCDCLAQSYKREPEKTALVYNDETLTYGELYELVNQLSFRIHHYFSKDKNIQYVPICVSNPVNRFVATLAVLMSGFAFVPIEIDLPAQRIQAILKDLDLNFILTEHDDKERFANEEFDLIFLSELLSKPESAELPKVKPKQVAYVIYTSGSTGNPKGVVVTHGNAINTIVDINKKFNITNNDKHLLISSVGFDLSIYDMFGGLLAGSEIVLLDDEQRYSPDTWLDKIIQHKVTVWNSVPTLIELLINYLEQSKLNLEVLSSIRLFLLSGDWIRVNLIKQIQVGLKKARIISLGGATEASIWSNYHEILASKNYNYFIPYGKPLANQSLYILNDNLDPVIPGGVGEIFIGGKGVSQGYLYNKQLTKQSFVNHPNLGVKLYRTGDLGCFHNDDFYILGRRDAQVKINGFRVELGDINAHLEKHPCIDKAVTLVDNKSGSKKLFAYMQISSYGMISKSEIISYLKAQLPQYMLPTHFYLVERFPLRKSGKIDFDKLIDNDYAELHDSDIVLHDASDFILSTLRQIWANYLNENMENINSLTNFYELGGDSITAIQIASEARRKGINFSAKDLLASQTIYNLRDKIKKNVSEESYSGNEQLKLSNLQIELLTYKLYSPYSSAYHITTSFHLLGILSIPKLIDSLKSVLASHDTLHARFYEEDGRINILNSNQYDINTIDYTNIDSKVVGEKVEDFINHLNSTIVKKIEDIKLSFYLIKIKEDEHYFVLRYHQVILDGWSVYQLVNEMINRCGSEVTKSNNKTRKLFSSYVRQLESSYKSTETDSNEFWKSYLKTFSKSGGLISGENQFSINTIENVEVTTIPVESKLNVQIKEFLQTQKTTVSVLFQVIWTIILSNITNSFDVLFGSVVSLRELGSNYWDDLIGPAINMVPVRVKLSTKQTILDLFNALQKDFYHKSDYISTPFSRIKELAEVSFGKYLFDSLLIIENYPTFIENDLIQIDDVKFYENTHFPITIFVSFNPDMEIKIVYNKKSVSGNRIDAVKESFSHLLNAIIESPSKCLGNLGIYPASLMSDFFISSGSHERLIEKNYLQYLEEKSFDSRHKTAVYFKNDEVSYAQLLTDAKKLALFLKYYGVSSQDKVLVVCESPSYNFLLSVLSIWYCGAIFCPISVEIPDARMKETLDQLMPKAILTNQDNMENYADYLVLNINKLRAQDQFTSVEVEPVNIQSSDIAYIIFTSGSTGKPKGVVVPHRGIVNILLDVGNKISLSSNDRFLAISPAGFDISLLEYLLPLIFSASVLIPEYSIALDSLKLKDFLDKEHPDYMQAVPTRWQNLISVGWDNHFAMTMLVGGEEIPNKLLQHLKKIGKVFNLYGPTETTIWSSLADLSHSNIQHLGSPLKGVEYIVVNEFLNPLPKGKSGELLIASLGMADCYLGQSEATLRSFIHISGFLDKTFYRTGDLVSIDESNRIIFEGRIDRQVKWHGYRIEMGDIEVHLENQNNIERALVVKDGKDEVKKLIAFLIPEIESEVELDIDFGLFFFENLQTIDDSKSPSPYQFYLSASQLADSLGLQAIWTPERHFTEAGGNYPNPSTLSAALAMVTKNIQLRAGSVVLPLHHVARVAEEWSVVDNLSNGRIGLAIASGWHSQDFCLAPESYQDRKSTLVEKLAELENLWSGNAIAYRDGNGEKRKVKIYPKPKKEKLPIWITAAGSPDTFALAGELGAHVLTHFLEQDLKSLEHKISIYKDSLKQYGHLSDGKKITVMLHTFIAKTDEEARELARPALYEYLKKHFSLVRSLLGNDFSDENNSSAFETYINKARDKLFSHALIGSVDTCLLLVEKLYSIGVNEIACLIDFGISNKPALVGVEYISKLADMVRLAKIKKRKKIDIQFVKNSIKNELPSYMLPHEYHVINEIPLNQSGKVDYQALIRKLIFHYPIKIDQKHDYDFVQQMIINIWTEILGHENFNIHSSFFEVGGHSLHSTQVISRIINEFKCNITLAEFFQDPTINGLISAILRNKTDAISLKMLRAPNQHKERLSYSQERMWFLYKLDRESPKYNDAFAYILMGDLNFKSLEKAINVLISRQASLRTRFVEEAGLVYQVIDDPTHFKIPVHDFTSKEKNEIDLNKFLMNLASKLFDLENQCAIKLDVIKEREGRFILLINMHHIITDGWSMSVLLRELSEIYNAFCEHRKPNLKKLEFQYIDYAFSQRCYLSADVINQELSYWKNEFGGTSFGASLPMDFNRENIQRYFGDRFEFCVDAQVINRINEIIRNNKLTLFSFLFSAFNVLLHKLSGDEVFLNGVPIANRNTLCSEDLLGVFVNTLIIKSEISKELTFIDFVKQTTENLFKAYSHQDMPFNILIDAIGSSRDLSKNPKVQTLFVFHNNPEIRINFHNIDAKLLDFYLPVSRVDLVLSVYFLKEGDENKVRFFFEYNTNLFRKSSVESLSKRLVNILETVSSNPLILLENIELVSTEEKQLLIEKQGRKSDSSSSGILEKISSIVKRHQNKIAISDGDAYLTYDELWIHSCKLANYLFEQGITSKQNVMVKLPQSIDFVVSLLAILQIGAVYIPVDIDTPYERIQNMIERTNSVCIIESKINDTINYSVYRISLEDFKVVLDGYADSLYVSYEPRSLDVACILHTSGTVGVSKVIEIPHRAILSLCADRSVLDIHETDIISHLSSVAFDAALFEIWGALLNGASLAVIRKEKLLDVNLLQQYFAKKNINISFFTTSLFHELVLAKPELFKQLDKVYVGGEVCNADRLKKLFHIKCAPKAFYNVYAPTEATTFATAYKVLNESDIKYPLPIGNALDNVQLYVLDKEKNVLPMGVSGELYIGGLGLSLGYYNDEQSTKEKFINNPFGPGKLYKTGDIVKWNSDYELIYLHREDSQIKLRGHRIDLMEIENLLNTHPAVRQAVVLLNDTGSSKQIVSFLRLYDDVSLNTAISSVNNWKILYDFLYGSHTQLEEASFKTIGWNSSFTRMPLANADMKEWLDNTITKLSMYQHGDVLEIGCGTGMLIENLASISNTYTAIDFSTEIIRYLEGVIKEKFSNVNLICMEASEISKLGDKSYDLIILNSVVQYFPNLDYLNDVITKAIELLKPNGYIFIGDVRRYDLMQAFYSELLLRDGYSPSSNDFQKKLEASISRETELLVHPDYFKNIQGCLNREVNVKIYSKGGILDNEMNKYRYDVFIQKLDLSEDNSNNLFFGSELILPSSTICLDREYANIPVSKNITQTDFKTYLSSFLPAYMIPDQIIFIEKFPYTVTEKIDRQNLLSNFTGMQSNDILIKPKTELEKKLYAIWQDLLSIEHFSIDENFFDLGGDSITMISLISKAASQGIKLSPKILFRYQTIKELSNYLKSLKLNENTIVDDISYNKEFLLSPIQKWFFAKDFKNKNHWNQAFLLNLNQSLTFGVLKQAVTYLYEYHDVFKLRFKFWLDNWEQFYSDAKKNISISRFTISDKTDSVDDALKNQCVIEQEKLNIIDGPLIHVTLFDHEKTNKQMLFICIHHLIVDGVSWRIIFDDLFSLIDQINKGFFLSLPEKTASYEQWINSLYTYTNTKEVISQFSYWSSMSTSTIPVDYDCMSNLNFDEAMISDSLSVVETKNLLTAAAKAFSCKINEVLLSALLMSIIKWTGMSEVYFNLDGHGREDFSGSQDISRTVGWFTSIFPVYLSCELSDDAFSILHKVKRQLSDIPNKGFAFGLLKYLSQDKKIRNTLSSLPEPDISFNYFGKFDQSSALGQSYSIIDGIVENYRDPGSPRTHLIEIGSYISNKTFVIEFRYNQKIHDAATIERFCSEYLSCLKQLVSLASTFIGKSGKLKNLSDADLPENIVLLSKDVSIQERKIYCIHPVGGQIHWYNKLSSYLSKHLAVLGVVSHLTDKQVKSLSIEKMAQLYTNQILEIQRSGDYIVLGWSFGAELAFEIAKLLEAKKGTSSVNLFVIDPQNLILDAKHLVSAIINDSKERYNLVFNFDISKLDESNSPAESLDLFMQFITRGNLFSHHDISSAYFVSMIDQYIGNLKNMCVYARTGTVSNLTLIKAEQAPNIDLSVSVPSDISDWQRHVKNKVDAFTLPGDHYSILHEPIVKQLADILVKKISA